MAKHRTGPDRHWIVIGLVGALLVALVGAGGAVLALTGADDPDADPVANSQCANTLRVVTARSFEPVLKKLAGRLDRDADCVGLTIVGADGRAAAETVGNGGIDLWIPDDTSWAGVLGKGLLAEKQFNAGSVVATSPIYMATDSATAGRIETSGGGWSALAKLLTSKSGVTLKVSDPGSSGDGLVSTGDVGEAVWDSDGMDASAIALADILTVTKTVQFPMLPLPDKTGEVGLVTEYALLNAQANVLGERRLLAGRDYAAMLRYTWFPTAAAAADPTRTVLLERLYGELTGSRGRSALGDAGLRGPDAKTPPPSAGDRALPPLAGKRFKVLGPHHVDHVFAIWYVDDRRTSLLMVVDVSGSMDEPAPGSGTPLIDLVRTGCQSVGDLLPDESELGVWEFGSQLDGDKDYRVLAPVKPLASGHRREVTAAVGKLKSAQTGTGLYDTILAAYTSAVENYQNGTPNQVLVFTDGRNEDDPGSITAAELTARIGAAVDPARPVALTVVAFGDRPDVGVLKKALKPADAYVKPLKSAAEVSAAFVHVAAGGLHG